MDRKRVFRAAPTRRWGDLLGDVAAARLEQDGELVAAEPRRKLPGRTLPRSRSAKRDEELVSGGVAEVVVDRLEAVEVDEEHHRLGSFGRCTLERLVHAAVEQATVREAGERVVEGLVPELGLEVGELGQRLLELLVLEQQRRVAREGAEELLVLLAERGDLVRPVADEEQPEEAVLALERGDDAVLETALGQVRAQLLQAPILADPHRAGGGADGLERDALRA